MSTLYQSSKDVPTEVLSARLNQLSHVVSSNRERIDAEFTMRIPAEVDCDADLVMFEAAVRLEALQAECETLRKDAERLDWIVSEGAIVAHAGVRGKPHRYRVEWPLLGEVSINWFTSERAAIDAAIAAHRKQGGGV